MDNKVETKGYWWLPSAPDKKVAGILTYTNEQEIILELIGSFYPSIPNLLDKFLIGDSSIEEKIIFGLTSESNKITLIDCIPGFSAKSDCPFSTFNYQCQYSINGTYLNSIDEKIFFKAYSNFKLLSQWCIPRRISRNANNDKSTLSISINRQKKAIVSVDLDSKTTLILNDSYKNKQIPCSISLRQFTYLEIHKKEASSVLDYLKDIYLFENFLSLATLYDTRCTQIKLFTYNEQQEVSHGHIEHKPIDLIISKHEFHDNDNFSSINPLFTYNEIESKFPYVIRKWYSINDDIAPIRQHLIESIKAKDIFKSIDFLIVFQAIEGFCIRFRKEESTRNMIRNIVHEFSCIDLINKDKILIDDLVDSRHYYSHFMFPKANKHILKGAELYYQTNMLRRLLICCLLDHIGFDKNEINTITSQSKNTYLRN